MKREYMLAVAVPLLVGSFVSGQEKPAFPDFMFWTRMTMGNVVSSHDEPGYDISFKGEWLENFEGGVRMTRVLSPALTGRLNIGVVVNTSTVSPRTYPGFEYNAKKVVPVLLDATLQYMRGGLFLTDDTLQLEFGYFPFKYNPQSTNLGEYLFRSGTYPGWLISGFENSIDRPKLAGVHVGHVFGSDFRVQQDLIVNTELDVFPYHDINLAYIVTPSLGRLFDCGFGVELARLIAVDPRKTTIGLDSVYRNRYDPKIGYIDTASGDTIRYTFRGTKLMGRAMLDIKAMIETVAGTQSFFGKEDLKVYGEAAVLGVKNYPGWYANRQDRLPVMVGMNWPTHQFLSYAIIPGIMGYLLEPKKTERKFVGISMQENYITAGSVGLGGMLFGVGSWFLDRILNINTKLDLLAIEVEYNPSPYSNAQDYIWKGASPVPYIAGRSTSYANYDRDWNDSMAQTNDDIRWSIYASKKIGKYVRISAQAACDHTPKIWYTPWPSPQSAKYTDMVPRTQDWYYMMRASFYF
jgi:hypothetical protein